MWDRVETRITPKGRFLDSTYPAILPKLTPHNDYLYHPYVYSVYYNKNKFT